MLAGGDPLKRARAYATLAEARPEEIDALQAEFAQALEVLEEERRWPAAASVLRTWSRALRRRGAGANARQMQPGSEFLESLLRHEAANAPGVPATSIYMPHDNLVAPQHSSRLEWAKNVALPGFGHIEVLHSARLADLLVQELREAGVEAPG